MEKYIVTGGHAVSGEVTISGAKNAVVAIIPAAILAKGVTTIENVPNISDVEVLCAIIREMGGKVDYDHKGKIVIDSTNIDHAGVSHDFAKALRASYYFIGVLLSRMGQADVAMPGGCNFGVRPIDQHIKGFEELGAEVLIEDGVIHAKGHNLTGTHIQFDTVSVGATINVLLSAVTAKGLTILENVAKEPHIVDLANFLNSMGADIRGAGTDSIKIYGVDSLHPTNYSIIPDQIEAGTYMIIGAAAGGTLKICNVIPKHLETVTDKLLSIGADVVEGDDWVEVTGKRPLHNVNVKTMPHPGFPTDLQPQMTTLLTLAEGTSIMTEGVWDGRFKYTDELRRMGANIQVDGKIAVIDGVKKLQGAKVKATDLRGGAAVIIAGLMAEGVTEIENIEHIERGYENLLLKMEKIGAKVEKVEMEEPVKI